MKLILKNNKRIKFFYENKIKVRIFLINGFKYEGYIKELIDEEQFGFDDIKKGLDILEYSNIKYVNRVYE